MQTIRIKCKLRLNRSTLISFLPTGFLVPLQVPNTSTGSSRQGSSTHLADSFSANGSVIHILKDLLKISQTGDLRLPLLVPVLAIDGAELLKSTVVPVAVSPSPPPPSRSIGVGAAPSPVSIPNRAAASLKAQVWFW
jgi:hypothetical protein